MKRMPVVLREAAADDVDHVGAVTALSFVDALERALAHIARYPASGSPRYATQLDLPGLRSWAMPRFPYLVFYVQRQGSVDVWRVLHAQRDIPAWLQPPSASPRGPGGVRESLAVYSVGVW